MASSRLHIKTLFDWFESITWSGHVVDYEHMPDILKLLRSKNRAIHMKMSAMVRRGEIMLPDPDE